MEHVCAKEHLLGNLETAVQNLENWQKSQNGSIHRIEGKIDKLIFWGLTFCASNLIALIVTLVMLFTKG